MEKTVSIIVPIYKVEQYLARCVDSILAQTYQNLEIILVDDGSPDNCGLICDSYAQKDDRVKVIHKKNGGLSDARNAGLDIATGEYIYFVDSDDWIAADTIAVLADHMDDSVDIVAGSSVDVQEVDGKIQQDRYSVPLGTVTNLNQQEAMKDNLLGGWAAWNKLYCRDLFETIRFPVGRINEDEAIMLHVLAQCQRIVKVGHPTYFYFLRPNSITTSSFSEKKMDWFYNCVENFEFIQKNYPQLLPEAEHRLECAMLYLLQFMLLERCRFASQILILKDCLETHYDAMRSNPYTTKNDRRKLTAFKHLLSWKMEGLYSIVYRFYRSIRGN